MSRWTTILQKAAAAQIAEPASASAALPSPSRALVPAPRDEWAELAAWLGALAAVPPGPWHLGVHGDHRGAWRTVEEPSVYLASLRTRVDRHLAGPPATEGPPASPEAWAAHGRVLAGELRTLRAYLQPKESS